MGILLVWRLVAGAGITRHANARFCARQTPPREISDVYLSARASIGSGQGADPRAI
jgi:hypothetical protein